MNCQLTTKLEMMHILQAHVCGCISANIKKMKRETTGAAGKELNKASGNRIGLKFGSEN